MTLKKRILYLTITIALTACHSKTEEKEHTLNSTIGTEGKKQAVAKKTEPTVKKHNLKKNETLFTINGLNSIFCFQL